SAVVLTYNQDPPTFTYINQQRFRPRPYVRPAIRCYRCQGWNHRQGGCRNRIRCARCGDEHATAQCKLTPVEQLRCANCKGDHSAASPSGPAYRQVQAAWSTVAMEKKSYAQALQLVISDNKRAPPAPTTAFPATAAVPPAVLKQWAVIKKSTQVADETMKSTLAQIADSLVEIRATVAEQTRQTTNIEARLLQMEETKLQSTTVKGKSRLPSTTAPQS